MVARSGNELALRNLLEYGADINKPDIFNRTPLYFAAELNCVTTVTVLLIQTK